MPCHPCRLWSGIKQAAKFIDFWFLLTFMTDINRNNLVALVYRQGSLKESLIFRYLYYMTWWSASVIILHCRLLKCTVQTLDTDISCRTPATNIITSFHTLHPVWGRGRSCSHSIYFISLILIMEWQAWLLPIHQDNKQTIEQTI